MLRYLPDNKAANKSVSFILKYYYLATESALLAYNRRKIAKASKLKKNSRLVSILLPTFNRSYLLRDRAIRTVLEQTYLDFELIIADDGSTDDTKDIVHAIDDQRIKYIYVDRKSYRYPNQAIYHWFAGPVVALNAALSVASGNWIARIDDDDEWTKEHLEVLVSFAEKNNFEFVSSDLLIFEDKSQKIVTPFDDPSDMTGIGATQTWLYRSYLSFFKYNINCWRKSYFRVNDTDLQQRMYLSGVKIVYLPKVTAMIRPRPDESLIGSKAYLSDTKKYEDFYNK